MTLSRAKKIIVVGAIAAGVSATAAAPAYAGIYTWEYQRTYATAGECQAAGPAAVAADPEAATYRCSGAAGADLYLGYVW